MYRHWGSRFENYKRNNNEHRDRRNQTIDDDGDNDDGDDRTHGRVAKPGWT